MAMKMLRARFPVFGGRRRGSRWTWCRSRGRAGVRFRRRAMFGIAIANPCFAMDCLYAFFKCRKGAVGAAAGEIRAPEIVLRVSAMQSRLDKNRDRDDQSPRHAGAPGLLVR